MGIDNKRGFTLVEIIVALGLTAILAAAVYKTFAAQQQVYTVQNQAIDLQQSLRAAVDLMTRELKMAGYDPSNHSGATIASANATSIHFSMDINGDGDCSDSNENITYCVYDSRGIRNLGRKSGAGNNQSIAQNVENVEFWYTVDNGGVITNTHFPLDPGNVTAVEINLLLKTSHNDKGFTDTTVYHRTHAEGPIPEVSWGPYNDGFRRRFATTLVRCRNMEFRH